MRIEKEREREIDRERERDVESERERGLGNGVAWRYFVAMKSMISLSRFKNLKT